MRNLSKKFSHLFPWSTLLSQCCANINANFNRILSLLKLGVVVLRTDLYHIKGKNHKEENYPRLRWEDSTTDLDVIGTENIAQQEPVKLGSAAAPFVPLLKIAVFPNCISDPPEGESMRLIF